jgi:hypothetical protein
VKGLKKGPELKMPDLKFPPFLVDLYWDLRDRRLLPLVALGVVAIVAVPFLLGGESKKQPPPPVAPVRGLESQPSNAAKLTVVEAKPGLRDYHKRLRDRSPTDPFKQRYTSPVLTGTKLGNGEEEGESSATSTTTTSNGTTTTSNGTTTTSNGTATPGSSGGSAQLTQYATAVDVKITVTRTLSDGSKEKSKPTVRKRVLPSAALPSEKTQAVVYMGPSPKTKKPGLLISDGVTAIFGEGRCLLGEKTCQLLEVEPGMPETFVFGPDSTRYKIVVLNPRPVVVGTYKR